MNLSYFLTESLYSAGRKFFVQECNVPLKTIQETPVSLELIGLENKKESPQVKRVYALGLVDDEAFEGPKTDNNALKNIRNGKGDYPSIIIIAIELIDDYYTRGFFAQITRYINRHFKNTPVTILFKYGQKLTLSNIERHTYKQEWREGEKVGKVTILKDVKIEGTHAGHKRILNYLSVKSIREKDRLNKVECFNDLYKGWQKVFNTSILNEQFYKDYQNISVNIIRNIYPKQTDNKLKAHQGALNLLNRMMFVYFIQKKGWLMKDDDFLFHFWQDYLLQKTEKNTFHKNWLNKLFFSAFNGKAFKDATLFKMLPEKYHEKILQFPYLNGGLFTISEEDNFFIDDALFEVIFDYLQSYIFTISEDTADEINLEINPELLGKMYEGMINATDLDDVDAEHGIVYTERAEINFMTRRSFVEVLDKKLSDKYSREFLYHFCFDTHDSKIELLKKYKPDFNELLQSVISITALDPTCGSGSMLLGVIQLQVELVKCLHEYNKAALTPHSEFLLKKQIISESIYSVDIKEWAVRIAELRFWLYMIADAEFTTEQLTKEPLLPNL
ncbi:MAG: hypothetical protein PHT69_17155, partial [Bacteroidales bacterium]|nr:hypothetical protein [Bacteroidales bacterium]